MHSKNKGNIGELSIAAELSKMGYCVFTELGDLSKVDLIAELDDRLIKIQCKALTSKNGKIALDSIKSGPGYKFRYTTDHFDVIAVYILDKDLIMYMSSSELTTKDQHTLRVEPTKNGQVEGIRFVEDYADFHKCIH